VADSHRKHVNLINIWGSLIYYKNKAQITKLESRAKIAILIGYNNFNSYKLLDLNTRKITWSRDVKVLKNQFYNFNIDISSSNNTINVTIPNSLDISNNNLDITSNLETDRDSNLQISNNDNNN
jgi:hypothetical protein